MTTIGTILRKLGVTALLVCAGLSISAQVGVQAQTLVIEGGTLIDGTGAAPVPNAVIVIEGSRIKSVGVKGKVSYPAGARVIDQHGATVLPGLIDPHIHFKEWMPPLYLHFGVTTVYDTNNPTEWVVAQRDAIAHGKFLGPRMFVSGASIDGPPRGDLNSNPERGGYNIHSQTPDQAKALVKGLVAQRVDLIKVIEGLNTEMLKGVVDEARSAGLPVVGHSWNIHDATGAGLKFMEHSTPLARAILSVQDPDKLKQFNDGDIESPEYLMDTKLYAPLIQQMVKEGVFINPTLSAQWRPANPRLKEWTAAIAKFAQGGSLDFVPVETRDTWLKPRPAPRSDPTRTAQLAEGFKKVQEFTREYVAAGGKAVAGSDTGIVPGLGLHYEMQSLVDAGLTPMQAILSATKWSAELMHKEKEFGTVEAGKLADLTIVEGDPLKDISATQNVRMLIQEGRVVDTALDSKFVNPLPRTVNTDREGPDGGPQLATISPKIAPQGERDVTIQVTGKQFTPDSFVRFDTTDLKTQFVSDSKLTATIDGSSLQKPGTYAVTVVHPGSGGGTSNLIYFIVNFRY